MSLYSRIPLLARLVLALVLGVIFGNILPEVLIKVLVTFSGLFSSFLKFAIPLIIIAFIIPGISQISSNAGKLLGLSTGIAYVSTLLAGTLAFLASQAVIPNILQGSALQSLANPEDLLISGYLSLEIQPVFSVMTALALSFVIGIGISVLKLESMKKAFDDFGKIIELLLNKLIIPLLPFYILGVFTNLTKSGEVFKILKVFALVFILILILHAIIILFQYFVAGGISGQNPFKMLAKIIPAYITAIGTQSSATTIPVTLESTKKMGVDKSVAGFTVPLFATIHLSGSTITLTTCATAVYWLQNGYQFPDAATMVKFLILLGITMVAAPGVPGGGVMAALGLLQTVLGFNEVMSSLMIALYISQDSFGTAANIAGDGALSSIVDRVNKKFFKE
ncbi:MULTISPECIES: cation:dicarboxylase symporter family transporter [unclassified Gemella]|uniref:cation:dicarboxylate symporter family transporter n=1 Tax=unclassified Gemella TaxID=2624949 RepID=UPI0010731141|nr:MULTISPECIES: cation:dicarboxylase symporter family transporter [unclassified Gemella]MBF0709873.1 cation:dicarboxylase symporter family transporter [Gemella sp. GL1.1]MBF0746823.1 cation:dicarboxylase symporter family transporter [Gemella sp. 19428wG2_WT2a]NYS27217.1 cation:dicarboxylase symporter family transporter [Gemella sp. GL1]TFU59548.1 cation:dicarboxylase symporter family transporter [Gemella sp. WT2a]